MPFTFYAFLDFFGFWGRRWYPAHCVAYTGTHDNDTILGWMATAPKKDVSFAKAYPLLAVSSP